MAPKAKEKPKAAASQPIVAIEDLFTSLNKFIERSEYGQAIKVAEQGLFLSCLLSCEKFHSSSCNFLTRFLANTLSVLSIAPGDEDALQCKIIALIRADSIDEAFAVIQSSQKLPIDLSFLKV